MIRNAIERRNAEKQLDYLRGELEMRSDIDRDATTHDVVEALRMQIADIENDIVEYDDLREGRLTVLPAESLDELGELLVKARIARGWSQAALAEALDMEPQQIQRYERNDWQKASLWRLQEAAEALELDVALRARLDGNEEDFSQRDVGYDLSKNPAGNIVQIPMNMVWAEAPTNIEVDPSINDIINMASGIKTGVNLVLGKAISVRSSSSIQSTTSGPARTLSSTSLAHEH